MLSSSQRKCHFLFLKSVATITSNIDSVILQMCLLLSFACLSGFTLKYKEPRYGGRFDFFYFATITSWLLVIILFVMFLLRLYERLVNINWNLVVSGYMHFKVAQNSFHFPQISFTNSFPNTLWLTASVWNLPQTWMKRDRIITSYFSRKPVTMATI